MSVFRTRTFQGPDWWPTDPKRNKTEGNIASNTTGGSVLFAKRGPQFIDQGGPAN